GGRGIAGERRRWPRRGPRGGGVGPEPVLRRPGLPLTAGASVTRQTVGTRRRLHLRPAAIHTSTPSPCDVQRCRTPWRAGDPALNHLWDRLLDHPLVEQHLLGAGERTVLDHTRPSGRRRAGPPRP